MEFKINIEFPCGYKYNISYKSWISHIEKLDDMPECPLHGKKCKRLKETLKERKR